MGDNRYGIVNVFKRSLGDFLFCFVSSVLMLAGDGRWVVQCWEGRRWAAFLARFTGRFVEDFLGDSLRFCEKDFGMVLRSLRQLEPICCCLGFFVFFINK